MGGKLFNLGRLPQTEYLLLEDDIRFKLNQIPLFEYQIPRWIRNKSDFGDVDIVVKINPENLELREQKLKQVIDSFKITKSILLSPLFSTVYRNFQVDYFLTDDKYFNSTYQYLSFNDLGHLVGKIACRKGLKYGMRGLQYEHRFQIKNQQTKVVIDISTDIPKVLSFLGFDLPPWEGGFETLDEMFEWVVASKYFSTSPYVDGILKNRLSRPTISQFLKFLNDKNINRTCSYTQNRHTDPEFIAEIATVFPEANLIEQIQKAIDQETHKNSLREKFNGEIVREITGLNGEVLGQFIRKFKLKTPNFDQFIENEPKEIIAFKILDFYKNTIR